ncbi:MAG: UvrB/UvrC motif-containing protein [Clostridia bacterium]|nr:UvrB/UvrC motif-containing protein [Clostridia bacterium]
MLCQNCNKREANVKYTQIINGEKQEMILCEECSEKLGINNISFDMPINFANFFDDILNDDYGNDFLPLMKNTNVLKCNSCGMTYEDFLNKGKFGCGNCYENFTKKIEPILKRIHGDTKHTGRKCKSCNNEMKEVVKTKKEIKEDKIINLQAELKKAIQEERYEDAAKIRDEIKKGAK